MRPALKIGTKYILLFNKYNVGKVPQWYSVQEGDATMMPIASLPGQKIFLTFLSCAVKHTITIKDQSPSSQKLNLIR